MLKVSALNKDNKLTCILCQNLSEYLLILTKLNKFIK